MTRFRAIRRPALVVAACATLLLGLAAPASAEPANRWVYATFLYTGMPVHTEIGNGLNTTIWKSSAGDTVRIGCSDFWGRDYYLLRDDVRGDGYVLTRWVSLYPGQDSVAQCGFFDGPR